jgi:hypothetical protein
MQLALFQSTIQNQRVRDDYSEKVIQACRVPETALFKNKHLDIFDVSQPTLSQQPLTDQQPEASYATASWRLLEELETEAQCGRSNT